MQDILHLGAEGLDMQWDSSVFHNNKTKSALHHESDSGEKCSWCTLGKYEKKKKPLYLQQITALISSLI